MMPVEAVEKVIKDRAFGEWIMARIDRPDVRSFVEAVDLARALHPRAIGDLGRKIDPLWAEYQTEVKS